MRETRRDSTINRNYKLTTLAATFSLVALGACKDPTTDKPAAKVEPAGQTKTQPASQPAGTGGMSESLTLSSDGSTIGFVGSKVTGSHSGEFGNFTGKIELADGKAEGGSVSIEIDMSSVTSDADRLTGHLKSDDFFAIEKHPKATFVSTAVKAGGEGGASHTVTGDLTLRGVTKSISFPADIVVTGEQVTAKSEFSINRKDFGVVYAGKPDDLIRDGVLLKLDIAVKRSM